MIVVKNLTKGYGKTNVIEDVSFTVPKGKITSFIGPNGAGKSTVLGCISRLMSKDKGEVIIDETSLAQWDNHELAKKMAILKQSNHLNIRLTVRELVSFGRFPYSKGNLTKEDESHIDDAIEYLELKEYEHRYLDQLSGGQRQRAYIAMVLAQNTEYILLDEPLNNLDMKHAVQIMKVLRKMVDERGKTIVLVMHDINFASYYSDYMIALKKGKLVKACTTNEMIEKEVLKEIYEMEIGIESINQCKICVYYQ